ncbi:hypothetical protein [Nissabacter sp. SGAir0207]|uniref:hypothetical protein n=1 Tax=Nissabacter sp. SGAir0207 TaxID=2126321 RepID=UPI0010CD53C4|nr:hypothetical protein [Nissabacter sp. SGAir0207]QCR35372.1 hypothetical protein C1N62_04345 [Nissabacter sp. SGAir0207]
MEHADAYPFSLTDPATDYRYLLLDPLKPLSSLNPLNINRLTAQLGEEALTVVPRADLAHSPCHCPRLVCLATPGAPLPTALLAQSVAYARGELAARKRYVCGWLATPLPPAELAAALAATCSRLGGAIADYRVEPFYEPLRMEYLHRVKGFQGVIWPIRQWWTLSASGHLFSLEGREPKGDWQPTWGVLCLLQQMDEIERLLSAWRQGATLPTDAVERAVVAWQASEQYGLTQPQDRRYLALNALTNTLDLDHPLLRPLLARAVANPSLLFTQLLAGLPQRAWQIVSHTGADHDA